MLECDFASSSDGSPQASPASVQELRRQLAEAKQQASSDLATAEKGAQEDLAAAQVAAEKLQEHNVQLEATFATGQMPCEPLVSPL